jgi:hypothetical protein
MKFDVEVLKKFVAISNIVIVILITFAAYCFGISKGMDMVYNEAAKNGVGIYNYDTNSPTHFYWKTKHGYVRER